MNEWISFPFFIKLPGQLKPSNKFLTNPFPISGSNKYLFDSILSNIWNYESYNFEFIKSNKFIKDKLKYIDPKLLLNSWNELLFNISKIHRLEYNENLLINF